VGVGLVENEERIKEIIEEDNEETPIKYRLH
jgi:hypothetical protein